MSGEPNTTEMFESLKKQNEVIMERLNFLIELQQQTIQKLSVTESKESGAASVTSSEAKKTRAPLTDEHKAKLKAGREAAKARRDAEKAAEAIAAKATEVVEAPKAEAPKKKIVLKKPAAAASEE